MKVKIIGAKHKQYRLMEPWWIDMIGEIIEVETNTFYWDIGKKYVYRYSKDKNNLISVDDVITLSDLRLKKLTNILE